MKTVMMSGRRVHVAIVDRPTICNIASGVKSIETRFSKNRIKPYQAVNIGDIVLLKESGGAIHGYFTVKNVDYIKDFNIEEIENRYHDRVMAPHAYWRRKKDSKYGTLLYCDNPVFEEVGIKLIHKGLSGWISVPVSIQPVVVCFAGEMGSGKSTYAKALAKKLKGKYIPLDSVTFKRAAQDKNAGEPLVFDGVRRLSTLNAIQTYYGHAKLVYVKSKEADRLKRYRARTNTNISLGEFRNICNEPAEREISSFIEKADYIIENCNCMDLEQSMMNVSDMLSCLLTGRVGQADGAGKGMTPFQRAIVIGSPGAGKSVFARALRDMTGLPLYYLDRIWHKPDKTTVSREEFDRRLGEILANDRWIIDGNYGRTLRQRLLRCDAVFLLDYPKEVCLAGAAARIGTKREDLPWVEEELDGEFRQWIEEFPEKQLPELYRLLREYPKKSVTVFRSREESERWLAENRRIDQDEKA